MRVSTYVHPIGLSHKLQLQNYFVTIVIIPVLFASNYVCSTTGSLLDTFVSLSAVFGTSNLHIFEQIIYPSSCDKFKQKIFHEILSFPKIWPKPITVTVDTWGHISHFYKLDLYDQNYTTFATNISITFSNLGSRSPSFLKERKGTIISLKMQIC